MSFWFCFQALKISFGMMWALADNIRSNKFNVAGMSHNVAVSNKKVIEVRKSNKHTFFIQSSFRPPFCEKVFFLRHQHGAVVAAVNLI